MLTLNNFFGTWIHHVFRSPAMIAASIFSPQFGVTPTPQHIFLNSARNQSLVIKLFNVDMQARIFRLMHVFLTTGMCTLAHEGPIMASSWQTFLIFRPLGSRALLDSILLCLFSSSSSGSRPLTRVSIVISPVSRARKTRLPPPNAPIVVHYVWTMLRSFATPHIHLCWRQS